MCIYSIIAPTTVWYYMLWYSAGMDSVLLLLLVYLPNQLLSRKPTLCSTMFIHSGITLSNYKYFYMHVVCFIEYLLFMTFLMPKSQTKSSYIATVSSGISCPLICILILIVWILLFNRFCNFHFFFGNKLGV